MNVKIHKGLATWQWNQQKRFLCLSCGFVRSWRDWKRIFVTSFLQTLLCSTKFLVYVIDTKTLILLKPYNCTPFKTRVNKKCKWQLYYFERVHLFKLQRETITIIFVYSSWHLVVVTSTHIQWHFIYCYITK